MPTAALMPCNCECCLTPATIPGIKSTATATKLQHFLSGRCLAWTTLSGNSDGSGYEVFGDEIPVDQIPEMLDIRRPRIAVVDVVGVLPDVAGQQGSPARSHGGLRIAGAHQLQRAIGVLDEPAPARAKGGDAGLAELLLEFIE